ncbi:hypothetical protein GGI00_001665, partial [Coemansia sp. RSA 2681]
LRFPAPTATTTARSTLPRCILFSQSSTQRTSCLRRALNTSTRAMVKNIACTRCAIPPSCL